MATKPELDDLEAVRKVVEALKDFESGDTERILRWVREKLGLTQQNATSQTVQRGGSPTPAPAPAPAPGGAAQGQDIRTFVAAKKPASDVQFAATIAYYYRFEAPPPLRKESITADDLQEACRQVNRDRMTRPAQTLVNAHAQGLLDRGERGAYIVNTVGENLVAMTLPPAEGARARKRPPGKTAGKKKAAKAAKRANKQ